MKYYRYIPSIPHLYSFSSSAETDPFLPEPGPQPSIEMDWQRLYKPTVDRIREFHQRHPEVDTDRVINDILYHGLEKYEHDSSGTVIQSS